MSRPHFWKALRCPGKHKETLKVVPLSEMAGKYAALSKYPTVGIWCQNDVHMSFLCHVPAG